MYIINNKLHLNLDHLRDLNKSFRKQKSMNAQSIINHRDADTKSKKSHLATEIQTHQSSLNFFSYLAAVLYNLLGRSFDVSRPRGAKMEELRRKILV